MFFKKSSTMFLALCITILFCFAISAANLDYPFESNAKEIQIPINEKYIVVNGKKIDVEISAYLSEEGITMVPLKQMALLYESEPRLVWDPLAKNVTLTVGKEWPTSFVFTADEVDVVMTELNNDCVTSLKEIKSLNGIAEIKTINNADIFFVPLRTYTKIFGMDLSWEPETQTAIINKIIRGF